MWFIGGEVEQETSAPTPNKNPGSASESDVELWAFVNKKNTHTHPIVFSYEKHCFWIRKSQVSITKPSTVTW